MKVLFTLFVIAFVVGCNNKPLGSDKTTVAAVDSATVSKSGAASEQAKLATKEFLVSHNVDPGKLDYINDEFLLRSLNAKYISNKTKEDIDKMSKDADSKTMNLAPDQHFEYINNIVESGDRIIFYTSCYSENQYWILNSQTVSAKEYGFCGNWTIYKLIYTGDLNPVTK